MISVSILDRLGYSLLFGIENLNLYHESLLIGNGTFCGNLYKLDLHDVVVVAHSSSLNTIVGSKCRRSDMRSYMLWQKYLGHISRNGMERLVKDGML